MTPHARTTRSVLALAVGLIAGVGWVIAGAARQGPTTAGQPQPGPRGATVTRLADGRWLVAGGEGSSGPLATARLVDPRDGSTTVLSAGLTQPRFGHTATLLADGTVLIAGGESGAGQMAEVPERFDPSTMTFGPLAIAGAAPRVWHTATLLTDGRVLVTGGSDVGGTPTGSTEIWDLAQGTASPVAPLAQPRDGAHADVLADGRVLITGGSRADGASPSPEIFDPATLAFSPATVPAPDVTVPRLAASLPGNGATDVPLDVRLALRFSQPMVAGSLTAATITLTGTAGPVEIFVVPAENGRLAFVSPRLPLSASDQYRLSINGAVDWRGVPMVPASVAFATAEDNRAESVADQEAWTPGPGAQGWRANRPDSVWQSLPALQGVPGETALAGQVLRLDGRPLADVTLTLAGRTARSDRTGRFLLHLAGLGTGEATLAIDARTANDARRTYGFYEARVTVRGGVTTVLPFTIWSPLLDTARALTIPSPTTRETVLTTPTMPGLELHLPAGTVIRDEDGRIVRQVTMTPIPLDRPPFPLPEDATFTMFFTIQPGGAYIQTPGPVKGAWLVYPNRSPHTPGTKVQFYNYDPDDKGWYVYGLGTITATQVIPDPKTLLYGFTGASFNSGPTPEQDNPPPGDPRKTGDPINPATGTFVMRKTDLYVPDVVPLALTRVYNSTDTSAANSRAFGIGMTYDSYSLYQYSTDQFNDGDLILPDGSRVHYVRISAAGLSWNQTVMECQTAPTAFFKSRLFFDGNAWEYALKDGTTYVMGHMAGLQSIRDRSGNTTRFTWSQTNTFGAGTGNLVRLTSPNGRWIQFTYDTHFPTNRVTQATDNLGRTVSYTYDASGRLSTVTDPEQHVTTYTWDGSNRLLTITDGRQVVYLTNHYDASGRVDHQTLADPNAAYSFAYTTDGGGTITQTDVTDPRGHVERLAFNSAHYLTSDTEALGEPEQRTTTTERDAVTNYPTAVVDGLSRRTEYTYDGSGHVLTTTRLAGTADAVTTTYTYEPQFFQLATVTDPLSHTWTVAYDAKGRLAGVTDPLSHQTLLTTNIGGQVTSVTDPLQHTWQIGFAGGDQTAVTNPLGAVWRRFLDAGGRVLATTDPLGRVTRQVPDKLSRVTATTDPLGGQTAFAYDANGNLLTLTDARQHTTSYSYDASDRTASRTDPVGAMAAYGYDRGDHLTQTTDRKGQVTTYQYDALNRLAQVSYADSSTIQYTYDAGDRLTAITDSIAGTIARTYDGLDRLLTETTPEGTVTYTYDADGRRATMTVAGQPEVAYTYDDAHRLTSITQDTSVVGFTYDDANRRSTLAYPNGIVATYGYDTANQLTSLSYALGQTTLGDLTYTYDLAGNRTSVGGSWARTGLPQAMAGAAYDAANRIQTWGGQTFSYDANGSVASDGLTSYGWSARNQLIALSGAMPATFAYDATGRRRSKTVDGITTNFLWDEFNLVQELAGGGTPTANLPMASGIDEIPLRVDGAGARTPLVDGIGSTVALADAYGVVQTRYTFAPFGATTTSGPSSTNSVAFTGREDDLTGLYYYRARYYSPGTSRFIAEDRFYETRPLPPSQTVYTYVKDSPIRFIDPSGEDAIPIALPFPWISEIGVGAGVGVGVGVGAVAGAAWCATSPACRQYMRCLWQLMADIAKCTAKGLCPGTDPDDTERCLRRAWENFWSCAADMPPKYPKNPNGTLPFPKR